MFVRVGSTDWLQSGTIAGSHPEPPRRGAAAVQYFMILQAMLEIAVVTARLAQLAERKALNLVVVGSSPTVGA